MILYHGSDIEIRNPQIIVQDKGRDFGFGFYTTSIKDQAERWAIRKARISSRFLKEQKKAVVNIYEFDESVLKHIKYKEFKEPNLEWLEFVIKCRSDLDFKHDYDIISGKIANDNVGETVEFVLAGIMRKEDAVERLKFEKINNQICFCSENSLPYLKFVNSYVCNS